MQSLTQNEARVMDFLIRNFQERNSVNEIGKRLELSPMGAYKILKKLEKINAVVPEKIGNALYYKPNLNEEIGAKLSELVLIQNNLSPYAQIQAEDLNPLKDSTLCCVLFGSVLTKGKEANDIDILVILEKKDFSRVSKELSKIKSLKPKKIHELMQTKEDLLKNIQKGDKVILDIIKTGKILWGAEIIVEAIKNGSD
ncbi:MAG: winged helix-turn-helix domain-containing protein [Nanoarchaeota archaeon]|nr:winged helix-turn-helix domain-containing protein [Nanoarchaeota archaeon]MBU1005199.1 winged helix-turn-helix domain-containing protein [Nanoarchaeota archaeon]MBU1946870.1 winged helix-turn-helix domain-containing protein [Nanoarchaeota archaeon]